MSTKIIGMKKIGVFALLMLIVLTFTMCASCSKSNDTSPVDNPSENGENPSEIPTPEGYKLVWQDEFNQSHLSGNKPALPDDTKWKYETGNHGWGNNEIQNYVPGIYQTIDTCAQVKEGSLHIVCKKVGEEIISIRMNSRKSWTYAYIEARMKLPTGKGTWPALWMLPDHMKQWPNDGEIDIMEEVGYQPNVVVGSIHCEAYNHLRNTQKTANITIPTAQTEYHTYALEWTETHIKTFVDGVCYFTFLNDGKGDKNTWPFNKPFHLLLNLAWGGTWGGAQGVDENKLPAIYSIDYIRVFQRK
jgi:hypothetical protein